MSQSEKRVAYLTDKLSAAQARLQELGAQPLNSPRACPTPSYLSGGSNYGRSSYESTFGSSYTNTSSSSGSSSGYPSLSPYSGGGTASAGEVEQLREQVRRLSSELVRRSDWEYAMRTRHEDTPWSG